ncbi:LptF/LptG family permease [bacterium]|nr:LptF/LptG family permease [bacterium]
MMDQTSLFPSILTRYVFKRFSGYLILCLFGLISIFLLVEFFERLDNLMGQRLSMWIMIEYLLLRLPQTVFQLLPVAVLMAALLTLGGMAKDGELTAILAGGINLFQIIVPLISLFLGISILSGLYQVSIAPILAQKSSAKLALIKGEVPIKKLAQGRIWLAGKHGRFFHIQLLDEENKTLDGVTIFEVDGAFRVKRRWDIQKCYYQNGLWHIYKGRLWRFEDGGPIVEEMAQEAIAWPEEFSDFARIKKDTQEMGYMELKKHIRRLEAWGYKATVQRTDMHFKWALPFACLIFGFLGVPFAIRMHRGVKYISIGLSLVITFFYWAIMSMSVSMSYSGILPPVIGTWAANAMFGVLGFALICRIKT